MIILFGRGFVFHKHQSFFTYALSLKHHPIKIKIFLVFSIHVIIYN